jgi:NCS2 family nucleobase:cation symporter-2, xanthine/uracil permease
MGLVVWAGVLMTALVLTGFRTAVFDAVPESLKTAIVVGIGLFIAFVGLVNAGIIRRAETGSTPVVFGVHGHLLGCPLSCLLWGYS